MRDPYSVLGVSRTAGPAEIKAAFRTMAKAIHPDHNPDDPTATARFAEAGRAYEVLKDEKLRNRYDHARRESDLRRMEEMKRKARSGDAPDKPIDPDQVDDAISRIFGSDGRAKSGEGKPAASAPKAAAQPAAAPKAEARPEPKPEATATEAKRDTPDEAKSDAPERATGFAGLPRSAAPAADLVSAIVRRIRNAASAPKPADKVPDIVCDVTVSVEEIFKREKAMATLPDGQTLKVALPAGTTDGSVIRLKEQGYRLNGMQRGDVVVTVRVLQDGAFRTDGVNLRTTLPLDLQDAVLGCETRVATLSGPVAISIPAWSGSDRVVTLAGHGLADAQGVRGDLLVELRLMLREKPDDKVTDLMRARRNGLFL